MELAPNNVLEPETLEVSSPREKASYTGAPLRQRCLNFYWDETRFVSEVILLDVKILLLKGGSEGTKYGHTHSVDFFMTGVPAKEISNSSQNVPRYQERTLNI